MWLLQLEAQVKSKHEAAAKKPEKKPEALLKDLDTAKQKIEELTGHIADLEANMTQKNEVPALAQHLPLPFLALSCLPRLSVW